MKKTQKLLDLQVNAETIKWAYLLVSSYQNAGQDSNIKAANTSERKYLGTTQGNQNCFH
jgi:hypothetical protein